MNISRVVWVLVVLVLGSYAATGWAQADRAEAIAYLDANNEAWAWLIRAESDWDGNIYARDASIRYLPGFMQVLYTRKEPSAWYRGLLEDRLEEPRQQLSAALAKLEAQPTPKGAQRLKRKACERLRLSLRYFELLQSAAALPEGYSDEQLRRFIVQLNRLIVKMDKGLEGWRRAEQNYSDRHQIPVATGFRDVKDAPRYRMNTPAQQQRVLAAYEYWSSNYGDYFNWLRRTEGKNTMEGWKPLLSFFLEPEVFQTAQSNPKWFEVKVLLNDTNMELLALLEQLELQAVPVDGRKLKAATSARLNLSLEFYAGMKEAMSLSGDDNTQELLRLKTLFDGLIIRIDAADEVWRQERAGYREKYGLQWEVFIDPNLGN